MKENRNDYGIKINDKIPKLDNQLNVYHRKIKLIFEGKVFLLDRDLKKQEELKNGDKIRKNGEYKLKFISKNNEMYFINIKIIKLNFLFVLLPLFLIILSLLYFFSQTQNIDKRLIFDTLNYEYQFIGDKYVFDFNYGDDTYKKVELYDNVSNTSKIYPGSSGQFYIKINTLGGNKDIAYKMQVKQEVNKPKNLKFRVNGKIYNSINDLAEDINGSILENSNKTIKIEWFWEYETLDDEGDTNDGIYNENYNFLIRMIGSEKE